VPDEAPEVEIYTDGACLGNPGPGGWGAVLMHPSKEAEIYGGEKNTTNNRMELTAAIEALKMLKRPVPVRIYTDSSYVRNGVTKWVAGWKANGWRTAAKAPVKNQDLWEQLDELAGQHDIDWQWVKGHAGNEGNERADALAGKGAREAADG